MSTRSVWLLIATLGLGSLFSTTADAQECHTPPPDSISKTATMPAPPESAKADTSIWKGTGLNTTGGPIIRHTPQGSFLKRPGSRTWKSVQGGTFTDAQLRERADRERRESVRRRAHVPCDIVIHVADSAAIRTLDSLGIAVTCAPPCTLTTQIHCARLDTLQHRGVLFWPKGQLRPGVIDPRNKSRTPSMGAPPKQRPAPMGNSPWNGVPGRA